MTIVIYAGLLLALFGGMAAAEGQEAISAVMVLAGIGMMLAGAALHDYLLERKGIMADIMVEDDEDDDDGREGEQVRTA